MQKNQVTIKDVARAAGVNVSTASRALAGSYGVRETTREKILRVAEALKFRPNSIARGLVTGRSNTIGLLVSDIRNPFFAEVARGVEDAADTAGLRVFVCNSDLDATRQMRYFEALRAQRVDGVIINSISNMTAEQQAELADAGIPVVLLNRPSGSEPRFSTVTAESFEGGYLAAQYLMSLGHRCIGHITGPRNHGNLAERCRGFVKACDSAEPPIAPTILYGSQSYEGGFELTKKLLIRNPALTAIFAANDIMAFGALRALMEAGLKVPEDISVIGFDDLELASVITPPLTTIRQPKYEIGQAAVQILLSSTQVPERRVFGVSLIERQSCRAIDDQSPKVLQNAANDCLDP